MSVIDVQDPVLLLAPLAFLTEELLATAADHAGRRSAPLQIVPADRGLARTLSLRPPGLVARCEHAARSRPDVSITLAPPRASLELLVHGSQLVVLPRTSMNGRARHGVLSSRPLLALALPGHVPGRLVVALLRDDDSDQAVVRTARQEALRRGHELRLLLAASRRAGPVAALRARQVLTDWEELLSGSPTLHLSAATDSWGTDRLLAWQGAFASLVVLDGASLDESRLPRGDLLVVPPGAAGDTVLPVRYRNAGAARGPRRTAQGRTPMPTASAATWAPQALARSCSPSQSGPS